MGISVTTTAPLVAVLVRLAAATTSYSNTSSTTSTSFSSSSTSTDGIAGYINSGLGSSDTSSTLITSSSSIPTSSTLPSLTSSSNATITSDSTTNATITNGLSTNTTLPYPLTTWHSVTYSISCAWNDPLCLTTCQQYYGSCTSEWIAYERNTNVTAIPVSTSYSTYTDVDVSTVGVETATTIYSLETTLALVSDVATESSIRSLTTVFKETTAASTLVLASGTPSASTSIGSTDTRSQLLYSYSASGVPSPGCSSYDYHDWGCTSGCNPARCTIMGGTVDLLYWPVATTSLHTIGNSTSTQIIPLTGSNATRTAVYDGVTLTSPMVAISFQSAWALDDCSKAVGKNHSGSILPLHPHQVSSIHGNSGPQYITQTTSSVHFYGTWIAAPFNYTNLAMTPVPLEVYLDQPSCWDNFCPTIYTDYRPVLSVPQEVRSLDPAWASCDLYWRVPHGGKSPKEGVNDPPRALQETNEAAGPSTPAGYTITTSSATPSPTPNSPTVTPTAQPVTTSPTSTPASPSGYTSDEPDETSSPLDPATPTDAQTQADPTTAANQPVTDDTSSPSDPTTAVDQTANDPTTAADQPVTEDTSSPSDPTTSVDQTVNDPSTPADSSPSQSQTDGEETTPTSAAQTNGNAGTTSPDPAEPSTDNDGSESPTSPTTTATDRSQATTEAASQNTQPADPESGSADSTSAVPGNSDPSGQSGSTPVAQPSPSNAIDALTRSQQSEQSDLTQTSVAPEASTATFTGTDGEEHTAVQSSGAVIVDSTVTVPQGAASSVAGVGQVSAGSTAIVVSQDQGATTIEYEAPSDNSGAASATQAVFSANGETYTAIQSDSTAAAVIGNSDTTFTLSQGATTQIGTQAISVGTSEAVFVGGETVLYSAATSTTTQIVVFTAGGQTYTASQAASTGDVVLGNGGTTVTLSQGASTQLGSQGVSVGTAGAVIVGSETIIYSAAAPVASQGATFTASGETYTVLQASGSLPAVIQGAGTTATAYPGAAATINGQVVSINDENSVVVGTQTLELSNVPSSQSSQQAIVTVGGSIVTADQTGSAIVVAGSTISNGGPAVTLNGETLSLGSSGLVIANSGSTQTAILSASTPTPSTLAQVEAVLTHDSRILTVYQVASSSGIVEVDGTRLFVGGSAVTADGHTISAASNGVLDDGTLVPWTTTTIAGTASEASILQASSLGPWGGSTSASTSQPRPASTSGQQSAASTSTSDGVRTTMVMGSLVMCVILALCLL
ncbi:hypothetical protein LTR22_013639 [Elasticomyces elasticus]|nr:hypothetical protein LTR22_013639 [Elasticomyces elasticus]